MIDCSKKDRKKMAMLQHKSIFKRTDSDKADVCKIIRMMIILTLVISAIYSAFHAKFPGTTTDEFGYMFFPAKISGWDWTEIIKYHSFYGVGIGILWIPLFLMFKGQPTFIYTAIVVLNFVMLGWSFYISLACAKKMFSKWNELERTLSCGVLVLYPAYRLYAQLALGEIGLYLLMWLLVWVLIKIDEECTYKYIVLAGLVVGYMILIHYRTIGIAGVTCLYILYLKFIKKISYKQLFLFIGIVVAFLVGWKVYKQNYYNNLGELNAINQMNSSISVKNLATWILSDIPYWIARFGTRLFYYLIVGNICFVGCVLFFKQYAADFIRNYKQSNPIFLFIFLQFALNLLAFVIQGLDTTRLDHVVYARYTENIAGVFLLCGLYYIANYCLSKKNVLIYFFVTVMLTIITYIQTGDAQNNIFAVDSAVGFGSFFEMYMTPEMIWPALFRALLLIVVFCFVISIVVYGKRKKSIHRASIITICLLGIIWTDMNRCSDAEFNSQRKLLYQNYTETVSRLEELGKSEYVYIREKDDFCADAKYLQFLLPENSIKIIEKGTLKKEMIDENTAILVNDIRSLTKNEREMFGSIIKTKELYLAIL